MINSRHVAPKHFLAAIFVFNPPPPPLISIFMILGSVIHYFFILLVNFFWKSIALISYSQRTTLRVWVEMKRDVLAWIEL